MNWLSVDGGPEEVMAEYNDAWRSNILAGADMGAWAKWGGRRHEPLVAEGEIAATKDPNNLLPGLLDRQLERGGDPQQVHRRNASAEGADVPLRRGPG